jgi:hypothetical protein
MEKSRTKIKEDHLYYSASILNCNQENLIITKSCSEDLSFLTKFATLTFKDNSHANILSGYNGKKFICLKNNEGEEFIISSLD